MYCFCIIFVSLINHSSKYVVYEEQHTDKEISGHVKVCIMHEEKLMTVTVLTMQ